MPTQQEIFDKVVAHLAQQGGPAMNECGVCVYRAPNGRMCAVGCLIPDSHYNSKIESKDADKVHGLGCLPDYGGDIPLLLSLQRAHDLAHTTGDDPSELRWAANGWGDKKTIVQHLFETAIAFDLTFDPAIFDLR